MGDKYKSEIQKPVKNTLLSGASHGFPFESFQGSSLLIPVSQDSPSVLNDTIGDVSKPVCKDLPASENVAQVTDAVRMATLDNVPMSEEPKNPLPSFSQGYTGLFSSFFGGGQKKQELDLGQTQRKNSDQSSTPRSTSPFVTIPNIQSFSPALQVPSDQPVIESKPTGFSHSMNSPFSHIQNQGHQPNFERLASDSDKPSSFQKIEFPNILPSNEQKNEVQKFFSEDNKRGGSFEFGTQNLTSSLGFESFYNKGPVLSKAQSATELPVGGFSTTPSGSTSSYFNTSPFQNSASTFYQGRSESSDSFQPIQPPPGGVPPPSGPPLSAAPPMSGIASRNYRRDHHKRLAYAPVPGLTSNTAVSSSYLQPCENFSTSTSLTSSVISSPSEPLRQPLSGSLSQPALNISDTSLASNLSVSYPKGGLDNSLPNFFNSPTFTPVTSPTPSQPNAVTTLVGSPLNSSASDEKTQNNNAPPVPYMNQPANLPPAPPVAALTVVSSPAVHPPIMSTKEQPVNPAANAPEKPPSPTVIPASLNNLANLGNSGIIYRPAYHHWFYKIETKESKEIWQPFSMTDSLALEQAFNSDKLVSDTLIPTDGGRYDVNITNRVRTSVYWEEEPKAVRRCSWFYRGSTESRLHPYDENTAYNLEEEYKKAVTTNSWSRKVELPTGEYIIMYGPSSMALFQSTPQTPEGWEAEPEYSQTTTHRPKIVKRGVLDDFEIDDGESPNVDHLIFVVHGIGSVCDFKFRSIEEAVDGFRSKSLQLIKSHFRSSVEHGTVSRVEILPVSWHQQLHGETTGVDSKLQTITLKSIPKFRNFTNDTLLDILFYTSPVYCQTIMHRVGREINNIYAKFKTRNPNFKGGVSLVGHSLGSLILFDMLCHQKPPSPRMEFIKEEAKTNVMEHEIPTAVSPDKKKRSLSRNVSYVIGNAGTGQPFIEYPQLSFQPTAFFALGSPIGMFVTVRGIDSLGLDFCLPTCSRFFNIFHPFDPVAYRIEGLINPELADKRPLLIPHHKGRKRMHLELKETMARVGTDLKQRLVDSVRSTWNTVYQLTMSGRADDELEQDVHNVIEKQLERQRTESVGQCLNDCEQDDVNVGRLNQGRRIDYVLQEAPLESFTEYIFALRSHVIYWDSEDTMLLILKEIYGSTGISPDNQEQMALPGTSEDTAARSALSENTPSCSTSYGQAPSYGFK